MRFRITLAFRSFGLFALSVAPAAACVSSVVTGTNETGSSTSSSTGGGTGGGNATPTYTGPTIPDSTTCNVETIASGLTHPSQIVPSGDAVYVVGGSYPTVETITRVPLSGGAPVQVVTETMPANQWLAFSGLVADDSNLYWSLEDGSIYRTSSDGATTTTLVPPTTPTYINVVAVDSAYVYAARQQPGGIVRVPLAGGELTTLIDGPSTNLISGVAVDAANIYWGNTNDNQATVFQAPLAGGAAIQRAAFYSSATSFTWFNNTLFFTKTGNWGSVGANYEDVTGDGSAVQLPTDPTVKPKTVVWGIALPYALGVDASGVYWGAGFNDLANPEPQFMKVPITRIAPNGLVENVTSPTATGGIARCNGGICWTNIADGTVMRAKCDPNPPIPVSSSTPSPACGDFCTTVGDCSGSSCSATCEGLVAAPCEAQGIALTTCLASHFDELTCGAPGCDAESQALSTCRASPTPPTMIAGGSGGGGFDCELDATTSVGHLLSECNPVNGTFACNCYLNNTLVGTCSPGGCDPTCCNPMFNNALSQ
jgi:hypothetical protein